ncbi:FAD-dependent oxidoreductase [Luteococcus peritonei]|uniref:NAD(P)/FAD-dependent oxidoreductase n=1 Tax=Luteococcus peritonei TaxID=88874 RepID=A0ABW4RZJ1_9ACTN
MQTTPLRAASSGSQPHVVVVGAGIVGLSTAWFLQERGVRVSVLDRTGVAAGASWGNAGWISPGMSIPLSEPSVLRYGLKALRDPDSPLFVPVKVERELIGFLLGFARRCTIGQWQKAMQHYIPMNALAIESYELLRAGGVDSPVHDAPLMAAFLEESDREALEREFDLIREAGVALQADRLTGDELRAEVPVLSQRVAAGIAIRGQRYIHPGRFVEALADSVRSRGGEIVLGADVKRLRQGPGGITCELVGREPVRGDAVVLATGAWLPELARQTGVRTLLVGGRGYSFSVATHQPVTGPVYFPVQRVACTPLGERLRVGGTMEFRGPDEPMYPGRVEAIVRTAEPLLDGVDWQDRQETWVGARPVTVDNLPLVGPTEQPGVWVAGGHGMWGITLGPATGRLLAEYVTEGRCPEPLKALDPLR